jgi:hypothetical protein
MTETTQLLIVDQPYPVNLNHAEGAIADFLRPSGNRLMVLLPGMAAKEVQALRYGEMRGGFIVKNSAILMLWQFLVNGEPILTLDSPFDVRRIQDLRLYDVVSSETRLLIEMHAVDTLSGILKGIRAITMTNDMTLELYSAVQDQLISKVDSGAQLQIWMRKEPIELVKDAKMWVLGQ